MTAQLAAIGARNSSWKVKLPFEPSGVAQAAALAALGDSEYLIEALKINQQGKDYLGRELRRLRVQSYESYTNFLMMVFQSEEQVQYLFLELQKRGVITRPLVQAGLPKCLRVSIGLPEENRRFVDALEEIVKGLPTPY